MEACVGDVLGSVLGQESAPAVRRLQRLVATVEVHGLLGPVEGEVDLADLLQGLRRVLQPGSDPSVSCVGTDDGVDIAVQDGQPLLVPVQHESSVRVGRRPSLHAGWQRAQFRSLLLELSSVASQPGRTKRRCIGDGVELEVVDLAVELERDHPVDELRGSDAGPRRGLRVECKQPSARVADDAVGVVGSRDDLERAGQGLVGHGVHIRRVSGRRACLQYVDGLMHLSSMCVGRTASVEVDARADEGEYLVGQPGHHELPIRRAGRPRSPARPTSRPAAPAALPSAR